MGPVPESPRITISPQTAIALVSAALLVTITVGSEERLSGPRAATIAVAYTVVYAVVGIVLARRALRTLPIVSVLAFLLALVGILGLQLRFPQPAHAQATRTWVSGVGDDANPCSRTAPCKTFAGAISKTAASGEINAVDPGGFGAVTITKSITINGEGTEAGILAAGSNGVIVNAGVNDHVVLRNLDIDGAGNGLNGIRFLAGGTLHVENTLINGFTQSGIDMTSPGTSDLVVKDTTIHRTGTGAAAAAGIYIRPGAGGLARVSLDGVNLERNQTGLRVEARSRVALRDAHIANNVGDGLFTLSTTQAALVYATTSSFVSHFGATDGSGVRSEGSSATVRLSDNFITRNTIGLESVADGAIVSFGNNAVQGNETNGDPTTTFALE